MKRWIYLAFGLAVFILALAAFAPASLLPRMMPDTGSVELEDPAGLLWRGSGLLVVNAKPVTRLSWIIDPGQWLSGRLGLAFRTETEGLDFHGTIGFGRGGTIFTTSGQIAPGWINERLSAYDIKLSGLIELEDIQLRLVQSEAESPDIQLDGSLHWEGGTAEFALSGIRYIVSLPAMGADLAVQDSRLSAWVKEQAPPHKHFLRLQLDPDTGWVHVGVTGHLLELVNWSFFSELEPSAVAIEVSEKLL